MPVSHLRSPDATPTPHLSSTDAYFAAVNEYPTIEPAEERALLKTIQAGRAAIRVLAALPPDRLDQRGRLRDVSARAVAARKRLVEGHLQLAASIAAEHTDGDTDLLHLIQEGNLGLMRAIETYEPDPATSFRDYATASITAAITER